jgi:uncharacterized protein (DUF433 family)
MTLPEVVKVPLETREGGTVFITGTRFPLELLITEYQTGKTAEQIVSSYAGLHPADIHAVLAYYFLNQAEVNVYVAQQRQRSSELHQQITKDFPTTGLRERLNQRLHGSGASSPDGNR